MGILQTKILERVAIPYLGIARLNMFVLLFVFVILCITCINSIIKLLNYPFKLIYKQLS